MTVLLMQPGRPTSAKPKLMERRFRVHMGCRECGAEDVVQVCVADEPGDPATVHDFYESGALEQIEHFCPKCGDEMTVIKDAAYQRTPEEIREMG